MYKSIKRLIDIVGSFLGLVFLSPVFLLVALLIRLDSPGGSLYGTKSRLGYQGKLFTVYKFRTMVSNADELLWKNPELLARYKQKGFKLESDPRITRVGRILRKTGLDELPQLLNVLKGEMSLVGPRPYYPWEFDETVEAKPYLPLITAVRPGMTGPWQVSGRNVSILSEKSFLQRVKLEASYAKQSSFWYDMRILFKTVAVVFQGRGR